MAVLSGSVDTLKLVWEKAPSGSQGSAQVRLPSGKSIAVSWRKDEDGLWVETPKGVFGFDVRARRDDDGRAECDLISRDNGAEWTGLRWVREGELPSAPGVGARKGAKIKSQMPGKIIKVSVKVGDVVEKGQPVVVMEAMKMENEIRAPAAGQVKSVKVAAGQSIESGVELLVIEA